MTSGANATTYNATLYELGEKFLHVLADDARFPPVLYRDPVKRDPFVAAVRRCGLQPSSLVRRLQAALHLRGWPLGAHRSGMSTGVGGVHQRLSSAHRSRGDSATDRIRISRSQLEDKLPRLQIYRSGHYKLKWIFPYSLEPLNRERSVHVATL